VFLTESDVRGLLRYEDLVPAVGRIDAEIGEVFSGKAPGRTSEEEITLFKSVGVAVEDLAAADLVYREATRKGI
jgi:ornithine cyclodeaminase/alanine dehydrogenase-like protein (mu-crystallin family)